MVEAKDKEKQEDVTLSEDGAAFASTLAESFTDDDGFITDVTLIQINPATGTSQILPAAGLLTRAFRTVAVINVIGMNNTPDFFQTLGDVLGNSLDLSQRAYDDTNKLMTAFNEMAKPEPLHVRMVNQLNRELQSANNLQKVRDVLRNNLRDIKEKKKDKPDAYKKSRKVRELIRDMRVILNKKDPEIKTGADLIREYEELQKDKKFLEQNPIAQNTRDLREARKAFEAAHAQDYSVDKFKLKPGFYQN